MKERKKTFQKHELCTKEKFILRRKKEFMNLTTKEKLMLWISGCKKKVFSNAGSWQKDDLSIVFKKLER